MNTQLLAAIRKLESRGELVRSEAGFTLSETELATLVAAHDAPNEAPKPKPRKRKPKPKPEPAPTSEEAIRTAAAIEGPGEGTAGGGDEEDAGDGDGMMTESDVEAGDMDDDMLGDEADDAAGSADESGSVRTAMTGAGSYPPPDAAEMAALDGTVAKLAEALAASKERLFAAMLKQREAEAAEELAQGLEMAGLGSGAQGGDDNGGGEAEGGVQGSDAGPVGEVPSGPECEAAAKPLYEKALERLPWKIGHTKILSLGELDHRPGFHNAGYIYPVGFHSTRQYRSYANPNDRITYDCTITAGDDAPVFTVKWADDPDGWESADKTPTGAWNRILVKIRDARAALGEVTGANLAISGPTYFGFGLKDVVAALEGMPATGQLDKYVFTRQRAIGRAAALSKAATGRGKKESGRGKTGQWAAGGRSQGSGAIIVNSEVHIMKALGVDTLAGLLGKTSSELVGDCLERERQQEAEDIQRYILWTSALPDEVVAIMDGSKQGEESKAQDVSAWPKGLEPEHTREWQLPPSQRQRLLAAWIFLRTFQDALSITLPPVDALEAAICDPLCQQDDVSRLLLDSLHVPLVRMLLQNLTPLLMPRVDPLNSFQLDAAGNVPDGVDADAAASASPSAVDGETFQKRLREAVEARPVTAVTWAELARQLLVLVAQHRLGEANAEDMVSSMSGMTLRQQLSVIHGGLKQGTEASNSVTATAQEAKLLGFDLDVDAATVYAPETHAWFAGSASPNQPHPSAGESVLCRPRHSPDNLVTSPLNTWRSYCVEDATAMMCTDMLSRRQLLAPNRSSSSAGLWASTDGMALEVVGDTGDATVPLSALIQPPAQAMTWSGVQAIGAAPTESAVSSAVRGSGGAQADPLAITLPLTPSALQRVCRVWASSEPDRRMAAGPRLMSLLVCEGLWRGLASHPEAVPFVEEITEAEYTRIIPQPIALRTIGMRLRDGVQQLQAALSGDASVETTLQMAYSAAKFLDDVRLMWANCRTFNDNDSALSSCADALESEFSHLVELSGLRGLEARAKAVASTTDTTPTAQSAAATAADADEPMTGEGPGNATESLPAWLVAGPQVPALESGGMPTLVADMWTVARLLGEFEYEALSPVQRLSVLTLLCDLALASGALAKAMETLEDGTARAEKSLRRVEHFRPGQMMGEVLAHIPPSPEADEVVRRVTCRENVMKQVRGIRQNHTPAGRSLPPTLYADRELMCRAVHEADAAVVSAMLQNDPTLGDELRARQIALRKAKAELQQEQQSTSVTSDTDMTPDAAAAVEPTAEPEKAKSEEPSPADVLDMSFDPTRMAGDTGDSVVRAPARAYGALPRGPVDSYSWRWMSDDRALMHSALALIDRELGTVDVAGLSAHAASFPSGEDLQRVWLPLLATLPFTPNRNAGDLFRRWLKRKSKPEAQSSSTTSASVATPSAGTSTTTTADDKNMAVVQSAATSTTTGSTSPTATTTVTATAPSSTAAGTSAVPVASTPSTPTTVAVTVKEPHAWGLFGILQAYTQDMPQQHTLRAGIRLRGQLEWTVSVLAEEMNVASASMGLVLLGRDRIGREYFIADNTFSSVLVFLRPSLDPNCPTDESAPPGLPGSTVRSSPRRGRRRARGRQAAKVAAARRDDRLGGLARLAAGARGYMPDDSVLDWLGHGQWLLVDTAEGLEAVIASLNPLGEEEAQVYHRLRRWKPVLIYNRYALLAWQQLERAKLADTQPAGLATPSMRKLQKLYKSHTHAKGARSKRAGQPPVVALRADRIAAHDTDSNSAALASAVFYGPSARNDVDGGALPHPLHLPAAALGLLTDVPATTLARNIWKAFCQPEDIPARQSPSVAASLAFMATCLRPAHTQSDDMLSLTALTPTAADSTSIPRPVTLPVLLRGLSAPGYACIREVLLFAERCVPWHTLFQPGLWDADSQTQWRLRVERAESANDLLRSLIQLECVIALDTCYQWGCAGQHISCDLSAVQVESSRSIIGQTMRRLLPDTAPKAVGDAQTSSQPSELPPLGALPGELESLEEGGESPGQLDPDQRARILWRSDFLADWWYRLMPTPAAALLMPTLSATAVRVFAFLRALRCDREHRLRQQHTWLRHDRHKTADELVDDDDDVLDEASVAQTPVDGAGTASVATSEVDVDDEDQEEEDGDSDDEDAANDAEGGLGDDQGEDESGSESDRDDSELGATEMTEATSDHDDGDEIHEATESEDDDDDDTASEAEVDFSPAQATKRKAGDEGAPASAKRQRS